MMKYKNSAHFIYYCMLVWKYPQFSFRSFVLSHREPDWCEYTVLCWLCGFILVSGNIDKIIPFKHCLSGRMGRSIHFSSWIDFRHIQNETVTSIKLLLFCKFGNGWINHWHFVIVGFDFTGWTMWFKCSFVRWYVF